MTSQLPAPLVAVDLWTTERFSSVSGFVWHVLRRDTVALSVFL